MKSLKMLVFGLFLLSASTAFAQDVFCDPYNVYSGYGPTGYGRRRNMPLTDLSKLPKPEQQKIRKETVTKTVEKLKLLLNLDRLQEVVITNALLDNQKKQAAVLDKEISAENKLSEQYAILQKTDIQIMDFLHKEQKDKFNALIEERKSFTK